MKKVLITGIDSFTGNYLSAISFASHGKIQDFYKVNTIGTINILDTLVELDINPNKVNESLCPIPTNHYAASKYAMESISRNYFSRLNIIIARPFNYTGINQSNNFLIPKIVNHFKEKKKTIELNDIEFVCEAYKKLLESDTKSQMVNICSNRGIKLLCVIDMMNDIAGYKIEVKVNPAFVRKDEIKSLTGSPKKLFEMIGEVKQKKIKDTLKDMYND